MCLRAITLVSELDLGRQTSRGGEIRTLDLLLPKPQATNSKPIPDKDLQRVLSSLVPLLVPHNETSEIGIGLEWLVAELRRRLTHEQRRRLAALLASE